MGKRVIVTGGAGYIGSHVCRALAKNGFEPIAVDNLSLGNEAHVKWGPLVKGSYERVGFEVYSKALAVIHLAGRSSVGESTVVPNVYYTENVSRTILLLDMLCLMGSKPIIFSSSGAVYGNPKTDIILETHDKNPINPYGRTKAMVEDILEDANLAYGIRSVSLRYFNAAGSCGEVGERRANETHLIPRLVSYARREEAFPIYGHQYDTPDGTAIRDYVHVEDIADAHILALNHLLEGGSSRCYNVGTGIGKSVLEVIGEFEKVWGHPVAFSKGPGRLGDPPRLVADPSKIKSELNFSPKYNIENMLKSALDWDLKTNK